MTVLLQRKSIFRRLKTFKDRVKLITSVLSRGLDNKGVHTGTDLAATVFAKTEWSHIQRKGTFYETYTPAQFFMVLESAGVFAKQESSDFAVLLTILHEHLYKFYAAQLLFRQSYAADSERPKIESELQTIRLDETEKETDEGDNKGSVIFSSLDKQHGLGAFINWLMKVNFENNRRAAANNNRNRSVARDPLLVKYQHEVLRNGAFFFRVITTHPALYKLYRTFLPVLGSELPRPMTVGYQFYQTKVGVDQSIQQEKGWFTWFTSTATRYWITTLLSQSIPLDQNVCALLTETDDFWQWCQRKPGILFGKRERTLEEIEALENKSPFFKAKLKKTTVLDLALDRSGRYDNYMAGFLESEIKAGRYVLVYELVAKASVEQIRGLLERYESLRTLPNVNTLLPQAIYDRWNQASNDVTTLLLADPSSVDNNDYDVAKHGPIISLAEQGRIIAAYQLTLHEFAEESRRDNGKIVELTRQLAESQAREDILRKENVDYVFEIQRLKGELDKVRKELKAQVTTVAQLRSESEASGKTHSELQRLLAQAEKAAAEAERNLKSKESELKKEKEETLRLRRELAADTANVTLVRGKVAPLTAQIKELQSKVEVLDSEKQAAASKASEFEQRLARVKQANDESEKRIVHLGSEKTSLQEQIAALQPQIGSLQSDIQKKDRDIAKLKADLEAKTSELTALQAPPSATSTSVGIAKVQITPKAADAALSKELERIRSELQAALEGRRQLEEQRRQAELKANQKAHELEEQVRAALRKASDNESERQIAQKKVVELEARIAGLSSESQQRQSEFAALRAKQDTLEEKLRRAEIAKQESELTKTRIEQELSRLKEQLSKSAEDSRGLMQSQQREKEVETKRIQEQLSRLLQAEATLSLTVRNQTQDITRLNEEKKKSDADLALYSQRVIELSGKVKETAAELNVARTEIEKVTREKARIDEERARFETENARLNTVVKELREQASRASADAVANPSEPGLTEENPLATALRQRGPLKPVEKVAKPAPTDKRDALTRSLSIIIRKKAAANNVVPNTNLALSSSSGTGALTEQPVGSTPAAGKEVDEWDKEPGAATLRRMGLDPSSQISLVPPPSTVSASLNSVTAPVLAPQPAPSPPPFKAAPKQQSLPATLPQESITTDAAPAIDFEQQRKILKEAALQRRKSVNPGSERFKIKPAAGTATGQVLTPERITASLQEQAAVEAGRNISTFLAENATQPGKPPAPVLKPGEVPAVPPRPQHLLKKVAASTTKPGASTITATEPAVASVGTESTSPKGDKERGGSKLARTLSSTGKKFVDTTGMVLGALGVKEDSDEEKQAKAQKKEQERQEKERKKLEREQEKARKEEKKEKKEKKEGKLSSRERADSILHAQEDASGKKVVVPAPAPKQLPKSPFLGSRGAPPSTTSPRKQEHQQLESISTSNPPNP